MYIDLPKGKELFALRRMGSVRYPSRRGHGKESSGSLSPQDKDFSFDRLPFF